MKQIFQNQMIVIVIKNLTTEKARTHRRKSGKKQSTKLDFYFRKEIFESRNLVKSLLQSANQ